MPSRAASSNMARSRNPLSVLLSTTFRSFWISSFDANDFVPVVCPIGSGSDYHSYNVNADDAACAIATAMKASKLAFLTDIEGVYRNPLDRTSLISSLTISEAEALLESGNVGGGMLPKIQNCVDAVKAGVGKVHILDGRMEHSLLLEFFTKTGIGTGITGEKEEAHE